jgi:hypothetical protein
MDRLALLLVVSLVSVAAAGEIPPNAHVIDYGLWECDRGYVMRNRVCVPEAQLRGGPQMEVTDLPEAASEEVKAAYWASQPRIIVAPSPRYSGSDKLAETLARIHEDHERRADKLEMWLHLAPHGCDGPLGPHARTCW